MEIGKNADFSFEDWLQSSISKKAAGGQSFFCFILPYHITSKLYILHGSDFLATKK